MSALLEVNDLHVTFPPRKRGREPFRAVRGVSFSVGAGQTVALVGESGSGKTTIGRAILGLTPPTAGTITMNDRSIVGLKAAARRQLARKLQVVFQDPVGSLNPARRIGSTIMEPLLANGVPVSEAKDRVYELLQRVNMPADSAGRFPGHFSGGQRQRIAIARALAIGPRLVICDEPTSALDVSTQAQVLELLADLRDRMGLSYLFITHDLAIVREFASHVLVLREGEVVERGTARQVCDTPTHPYTRALLAAAPVPDPREQAERRILRAALRDSGN